MNYRKKGYEGELIAKDYLENCGYTILTTNFYCPFGELDIICKYLDVVVAVEVKRVASLSFLSPLYKLNKKKQLRMHRCILCYFKGENDLPNLRFDLIIIHNNKVNDHLCGVF